MIAGPIQGRLFGGESNKLFREVTCVQGRLSQKSTTYTLVSLHRVSAFTNVSLHKCQPHDFNPDLEEAGMVWIEIMPASSRVSHLPAQPHSTFPWWLTLHPFISQCRLAPLSWHTILFKSERGFPWSDFNLDQTWCQPQFQFGPVYTFSHCDTWVV